MKIITTETITGAVSVPVYNYSEIPYTDIMLSAVESKKRRLHSYLEIPCAFDIETTNIFRRVLDRKTGRMKIDTEKHPPFAFMYHWQFCIGYRVVFGRTWGDFQKMLELIERNMNLSKRIRLCIYVHNLAFEMQFMRKFLNITESFCKDDRQPLYVVHNDCIEFRCSAALSNMRLDKFCEAENATFYKLTDEFDYSKIRTSETELTMKEEGYCYNDVRGLCECIQSLMRFDTLSTMPLTNTGFVRRDSRNAMRKNKKNRIRFNDSALSADEYRYCRSAFRGGDTHANERYSNQTVRNVTSFDITSSYPACMMLSNKFPIFKMQPIVYETFERLWKEREKYLFLIHVGFINIECIAEHGMPYIPVAKCSTHGNRVIDNGRVKKAEVLSAWVTDIDLEIILKEYKHSEMRFDEIYAAKAGALPDEYKAVIMDYYKKKTTLKGLKDAESVYFYNKSKNQLNSLYGMMAMSIDKRKIKYTGNGPTGYEITDPEKPLEDILEKYYRSRNSFLPYQWSLVVTAEARKRLHTMMQIVGRDLVYVDTDSVKIVNYEKHQKEIEALNKDLQAAAESCGAFAVDRKGIRHYMGVWEKEDSYDFMRTLGAKKYVVQIGNECFSTIAGVSKKAGQKYFNKNGIDAFRIGAVIEDSGHLIAFYNDDEIHEIEIEGVKMVTASNVALIDDTYTIGITNDYWHILNEIGNA